MGGLAMNFMQRPIRGWLHDDEVIRSTGVIYVVRYIGCMEILASMKLLDYDTRFLVAKECIYRVCEAAGLKAPDRRRKVEKRVARSLGTRVKSDHVGFNVILNISSKNISLKTVEGNNQVCVHDMPKISFASGGDAETLDFVAYVAKDDTEYRACYVLECGRGLAQEVITTIGQAFNLRFKDYLTGPDIRSTSSRANRCQDADREYYNDLPGKVPPDVAPLKESIPPPVPPLPKTNQSFTKNSMSSQRERLPSTNLIDLNSELPPPLFNHHYVNDVIFNPRPAPRDVFDMQPFESSLSNDVLQLQNEEWFHGVIDRAQAESMLKQDGDFLVRESSTTTGQYILTGLQGGTKKHLLLIDPEGMVRTKDRMFENVSDLINYHCNNQLPIISAESALVLRNPIPRPNL
ncbi:SHC-transforming protein 1 isoform X2 [Cimex lectularius]|uniref:SHC-transforming protein 1 n=1 Tax=Cimex lectularius TaxID=79782 RepID=A0A8I6S1G5_CIMLE|nr:SHC-transforming protein 1 isoform X2 [Cimex lectularius]